MPALQGMSISMMERVSYQPFQMRPKVGCASVSPSFARNSRPGKMCGRPSKKPPRSAVVSADCGWDNYAKTVKLVDFV